MSGCPSRECSTPQCPCQVIPLKPLTLWCFKKGRHSQLTRVPVQVAGGVCSVVQHGPGDAAPLIIAMQLPWSP